MKMNKKGFTLVELLAVIVILAIIALIATPIILNVIDDARVNSAKNSAYGYIDAVEKANAQEILKNSDIAALNGTYSIESSGKSLVSDSVSYAINFKGSAPSKGTLEYNEGKLVGGSITVNGKSFAVDANGSLSTTSLAAE